MIAVVDAGLPEEPDEAALETAAKRLCPPAFSSYIGRPYQSSELEIGWILPGGDRLALGNQQIGCLAFEPTGKLTGSLRGTAR